MSIVKITPETSNMRLDKFLCAEFDISFGIAQKLIREKKIKVNGKREDATYKTVDEDEIAIFADVEKRDKEIKHKPQISPEKIKKFLSYIIYQDEHMVAINKPSGLAVQGGSSIDISVDDLLIALKTLNKDYKPALVHRLDKDTSGILLIALNSEAAEFLTKSFKEKTITKTYLALVVGEVKKKEGEIRIPLRKKFVGKNEKVYPDFEQGKIAITKYKLLKNFLGFSSLELSPITGRTHQLRVHCKEMGHAIINDVKYGGLACVNKNLSKRMCLHAYKVEIADYYGKLLSIKTEFPEFYKR